jgi:hypothetical protein
MPQGKDAGLAAAPVAVASKPAREAPTRARVDDAARSEEGGAANGDTGPSGESAACAALTAHNESMLAKLERADAGDGCPIERPDVNCVTTPGNVTWGYRLIASHTVDDTPDPVLRVSQQCHTKNELDLFRVDGSGDHAIRGRRLSLDHEWFSMAETHRIESLADYDGDGETEILVTRDARQHEGGPEHSAEVLTYRAGVLAPYAPAEGIPIEHAEDVDGDGRADLISRSPYAHVASQDAFGNNWPVGPAIFAFRSEADGTFRLGGPASIAFTRKLCPARPEPSLAADDFSDTDAAGLRLVCARLWGVPAAEIERAWDRLCVGREGDTDPFTCQPWPKDLAAIRPPFDLRAGDGGP